MKSKRMGVRTAVMASLEAPKMFSRLSRHPARKMRDWGFILRWGMTYGMSGSRKRKIPVDIDALIPKWIDSVVKMSTVHSKDAFDEADGKADELLTPLLSAPVKQVREFYHRLLETMKADERVPMIVWQAFDAWGEVSVKDAPDEGIKRLKRKLAADIADLVEMDIREQIPTAIKRALMWRDENTLKNVKSAIEAGAKPKLVGKESCTFLEFTPKGGKKVSVML